MYNILLVDDEMSVVDSIEATIPWKEIGIEHVYKALSAKEALQILSQTSIDIVITDIRMPEMDGLELIRMAKKHWKNIKYILLTGIAEFDYAQQAVQINAFDYILKPVSDEKILKKIRNAVTELQAEHDIDKTLQRALRTLREHLPKLREELMNDILQGKRMPEGKLQERLNSLDLPIRNGELFAIMIVRLETDEVDYDLTSLPLMEFAVGNIAEDTFSDLFHLWYGKDMYDFLVFIVSVKHAARQSEDESDTIESVFQQRAVMLQTSVRHYLKCTVSILTTKWGSFPDQVVNLYQHALSAFRNHVGNQRELFRYAQETALDNKLNYIESLYEPPLLVHLMETANWIEIRKRIQQILQELKDKWTQSTELAVEVYTHLYSAFSYMSHKNGKELKETIGYELADSIGMNHCRNFAALHVWAEQALDKLQAFMEKETKQHRVKEINSIKGFVQRHIMNPDLSLQMIADYMNAHPVTISKLFKSETGENLSEYIMQLKMEQASHMLKTSQDKVYEIAFNLGYQNPNYFIRVFKKYFGLTPQEYRQQI